MTFDPGNKLLDFDRIHAEDISNTEKEWELGKVSRRLKKNLERA